MKVLACGGRDFGSAPGDRQALVDALDRSHAKRPMTALIQGAARGADSLAAQWARSREVQVETYPADWNAHGKAAGHMRNQRMLTEGKPDGIIAFPGGRGTADMTRRARRAGIPVWRPLG